MYWENYSNDISESNYISFITFVGLAMFKPGMFFLVLLFSEKDMTIN